MLGAPAAPGTSAARSAISTARSSPAQVVVCEVSSFQLEDVHEFRPRVAVLLNLEPDHLDRHGSIDAYRAAKLRIFENQRRRDVAVVPRGFDGVPGPRAADRVRARRRASRRAADPRSAQPRERRRCDRGRAARSASRTLGSRPPCETFPGVAHRLEPVAEVGGVRFVNDSKATNTAAARRAVAAYDAPLHLILGGRGKGESYTELALDMVGRVRRAYLIGEAASDIAPALERAGVDHELSGDLETALRSAAQNAQPGEVVLLAPACASYDQFRDYEERGDAFKRLVEEVAA